MSGTRVACLLGVLIGVLLGLPLAAAAHPLAPSLWDLREVGGGRVEVRWRTPLLQPVGAGLVRRGPSGCTPAGPLAVSVETGARVERRTLQCGPSGLIGRSLRVEGARGSGDVLLRIAFADGRRLVRVLPTRPPGAAADFVIPARESRSARLLGSLRLGLAHIAGGFDHLLFVLGLVLLVGSGRRLLWTVSSFTVGHSITLGLAVLGVLRLPVRWVEVGIAVSILAVAVELARPEAERPERMTPLLAGGFGLLHGLGFAAAVATVGLARADIPWLLLGFNVGIELGQLAFVGLILAAGLLLQRLPAPALRTLRPLPAYVIGSLSAFWIFERLAAAAAG